MIKDKSSLMIIYGILILLIAVQTIIFITMPKDVQTLQTSQYMYSRGDINVYMGDSYGNTAKVYLQINGGENRRLRQGENQISLKEGDFIAVITEGMETNMQYSNIVIESNDFAIGRKSLAISGGLTPIGRMNLKKN